MRPLYRTRYLISRRAVLASPSGRPLHLRIKATAGREAVPPAGAGADACPYASTLARPVARPRSSALSQTVTWKTRNPGLLRENRCAGSLVRAPPPHPPVFVSVFFPALSLLRDFEVSANYWWAKPADSQRRNGRSTDAARKSRNPEVWLPWNASVSRAARCRGARTAAGADGTRLRPARAPPL